MEFQAQLNKERAEVRYRIFNTGEELSGCPNSDFYELTLVARCFNHNGVYIGNATYELPYTCLQEPIEVIVSLNGTDFNSSEVGGVEGVIEVEPMNSLIVREGYSSNPSSSNTQS